MPGESGGSGPEGFRRSWLWRWGVASWLLLGIVGIIIVSGMAFGRAHQVLIPLIVAAIIGVLLQPFVAFLSRHHIPRWLAVIITMILIISVLVGFVGLIIYGVSTQAGTIERQVQDGITKIKDWFDSLKLSDSIANWIHQAVEDAWPHIQSGLMKGLTENVSGIASFLIGFFIGFFMLIFLLGDDGTINNWLVGHMGVPRHQGEEILDEVIASIRGYFKGTTIIAVVDTIFIIPMVLILRMPLVGPIALVTFVTCYIPSFGGYIGGAFAVFIALASQGLTAGIIMLVYAILVHTVFQGPVQAVAYGKTLKMHPLLALLVTLLGAVFGGIAGAILAVPLTAVVLKVAALLRRTRAGGDLPSGSESMPPSPESPAPSTSEPT